MLFFNIYNKKRYSGRNNPILFFIQTYVNWKLDNKSW